MRIVHYLDKFTYIFSRCNALYKYFFYTKYCKINRKYNMNKTPFIYIWKVHKNIYTFTVIFHEVILLKKIFMN